ncbi:MAG: hypothetical protein KF852_01785 [Saprospiraceae bacterium]|nr:hypothetical protein [Saprospiraceae bacterium]
MKRIDFFTCAHGFGHIRRVLKTVEALYDIHPFVRIRIHVNSRHLKAFSTFLPEWLRDTTDISRIEWVTNSMKHCPDFSTQEYKADQYEKWVLDIQAALKNEGNSLVISDNLVTPAFYNEKAILMGSFLWSSIVSPYYLAGYQIIAEQEKALLYHRTFKMLALQDMAMPDVTSGTDMIPLPWFCDNISYRTPGKSSTFRVLITVGGTSKRVVEGLGLLKQLIEIPEVEYYVDQRLFQAIHPRIDRLRLFDFSETAFKKIDIVIARPGIGILTDAVAFNIPIMAIGEKSNAEMVHNASVIQEKGWGWNLLGDDPTIMESACKDIFRNEVILKAKSKLAEASCGGAELAANYILSQLN